MTMMGKPCIFIKTSYSNLSTKVSVKNYLILLIKLETVINLLSAYGLTGANMLRELANFGFRPKTDVNLCYSKQ